MFIKIVNNNKHQEKKRKQYNPQNILNIRKILFFKLSLFSVCLCRAQLKSFFDFNVVCNVTWQYFKDIICGNCMVCYWSSVTRVGDLTPIHWGKK